MRLLCAVILGVTLSAVPTLSAQEGIHVEGTLDCGEWVAARRAGEAGSYGYYLLGLLNGLAIGNAVEFWRAGGRPPPSREAIYLWMDGYCTRNPLADVVEASMVLFGERSGLRP